MKFIIKLFLILLYLFIIYYIYLYSEFNNKNKSSNAVLYQLENQIYQNIDSYFMQTNVLLNNELIDNINKSDYKKIELSFDNFIGVFTNCELIILSDLKGKILATNTKNSRYKSFNNTELKTYDITNVAWYKGNALPSKLKDLNFANTFYLEKIASNYKNTTNVEILVSIIDISGNRIGVLTFYYNLDAVIELLNRFNISFKDINNKNIGANITFNEFEFNKTNFRYINNKNFKILNNDYKLYNIISVNYINIYILSILIFNFFIVLILNFRISILKKLNLKLQNFNKIYKELGIFLEPSNKNNNSKPIKFKNNDIFVDADFLDLISKNFIEEIIKLEELVHNKNDTIDKLEVLKEANKNLDEKNNILNQEIIDFEKKLLNLNKYLEKILSIEFLFDTKNNIENKDKLDFDKYLEEEKALLHELLNSKNIINKLIENIYNTFYLNNNREDLNKLITLLKEEFFKLKVFINNINNLIKDLNIEALFKNYKNLYDKNLELANIYNALKEHNEKSTTYENALKHIKSVLDKKD